MSRCAPHAVAQAGHTNRYALRSQRAIRHLLDRFAVALEMRNPGALVDPHLPRRDVLRCVDHHPTLANLAVRSASLHFWQHALMVGGAVHGAALRLVSTRAGAHVKRGWFDMGKRVLGGAQVARAKRGNRDVERVERCSPLLSLRGAMCIAPRAPRA